MKLYFINNKNANLVLLSMLLAACLLLILGAVFFIKKNQVVEAAKLNNQSINLSINSDDNGPVIAIVVSAVGSLKLSGISDLSSEISIGVPSYIDLIKDSKLLEYNIALNIPLESNNYPEDEEPNSLLIKDSSEEIKMKLNNILEKQLNYQAVYTSSQESYTNSYSRAEYFLELLQNRNLIYLSEITNKDAIIYEVANKLNYSILKNDIILDAEISSEHIMKQLLELENIAKQSGLAIAMGNAYPLTLKLIEEWVSTLPDKNIKLVSIKDFYTIYVNRKLSAKKDNINAK